MNLAVLLAAEGAPVINPVVPELAEMFWAAVFFFGLWALMKYVCLPPVLRAMQQRDETIQSDLEAAESARSDAETVRRDYDVTLAEARAEAAGVLEAARAKGDERRVELMSAAEADVAAQRDAAMIRIAEQRGAAMDQLKGDLTSVAVGAASKVMHSDLDVTANQTVVDDYVAGNN